MLMWLMPGSYVHGSGCVDIGAAIGDLVMKQHNSGLTGGKQSSMNFTWGFFL